MIKLLKNRIINISLVVATMIVPSSVIAASASGAMEGSSESISAAAESPTFEGQIARINIGINLIRLNTDIMQRMPVSEDAEWVDKVVETVSSEMYQNTLKTKALREDPYYSTVLLTNIILRRPAISVSPLSARLFYEASVIYKNETNGYEKKDNKGEAILDKDGFKTSKFKIPNMNNFPDISNMETYTTFKAEKGVEPIKVNAIHGKLYPNVEEAVISLLPEDLIENVQDAKKEKNEAAEVLNKATSKKGVIEAWIDDDANSGSPDMQEQKSNLEVAEAELKEAEVNFEAKEDAYYLLLESGAEAIAASYDEKKVPLAEKLEKLLDTVDNNAVGAISMFTAATAGLYRGNGVLKDEMKAILAAQALTTLVGNQKEFLVQRYERMAVGAIMAVPNIAIGTYKASSQLSAAGKYQKIVNKVLEAAKADKEAKAEAAKAEALEESK
jgi:hypothetical protein